MEFVDSATLAARKTRPAFRRCVENLIDRAAVRRGIAVTAVASAIALCLVGAAGYFDRSPFTFYPEARRTGSSPALPVVVSFSGDMGLRFLLGASTSRGLVKHGYAVMGVNSSAMFRRRLTRADITARVADSIRLAMNRTGARNVVVMGQSYGADIVQTGLADLPADLRRHIIAIVLVLPGDKVFFRADPTGLLYMTKPDSIAVTTANTLTWAPVTCIYGIDETDSLCPLLHVPPARIISMPGGHTIDHDAEGLLAHVLKAIAPPFAGHPPGSHS